MIATALVASNGEMCETELVYNTGTSNYCRVHKQSDKLVNMISIASIYKHKNDRCARSSNCYVNRFRILYFDVRIGFEESYDLLVVLDKNDVHD